MITAPSLLRRGRTGAVAALALAGALSGCWDEPERSITAPERTALSTTSSGTWPPNLDPFVRNPPFIIAAGKTYRIWYMLENTAPDTRSYWVAPWEPTGNLEFPKLTREYYGFAPGEKRWIFIDFTVKSGAADGTQLDFYFSATDLAGEAYGKTQHILQMQIANSRPVVAVEGGEHHTSILGQKDTINVWVYNPRPEPRTICIRWLEDEGAVWDDKPEPISGTAVPAGQGLCKGLNAQEGYDTAYVYTYNSLELRRQTLQAWTTSEGHNEPVHTFRKTTVVSSAPKTNRFYAFTQSSDLVGPGSPLPLFSFGTKTDDYLDRNYVSLNYWGDPCQLSLDTTWPDFVRRNLGETYVIYEEPGQGKAGCVMPASVYAQAYHDMTHMIKNVDPSARIATGFFEQENIYSDPPSDRHFVRYADDFWWSYNDTYKQKPPIAEWTWILYMAPGGASDDPRPKTLTEWTTEADSAVSYSLGTSAWSWQRKPSGVGTAPVGIGIALSAPDGSLEGKTVDSSREDWDTYMTGMVDYLKTKPGVVAGFWWVLEKWGTCAETGGCTYRLSDDGVNLNKYGVRYKELTQ